MNIEDTYLGRIVSAHRARAESDRRDLQELKERCQQMPPTRPFGHALREGSVINVIAEVKRASPSKGPLNADLDARELALDYERSGAAAISVLTDMAHFGARKGDLAKVRTAVELPVLRKDFTVSALDVCDARLMGADAVLLIVAALTDHELAHFGELAADIGIETLVETHDEAEVRRALNSCDSGIIGVNQRDLFTFDVDQERAVRVSHAIPNELVKVAESGIRGPADVTNLASAGFDAVLVGEHLVTSQHPGLALEMLRVPRAATG